MPQITKICVSSGASHGYCPPGLPALLGTCQVKRAGGCCLLTTHMPLGIHQRPLTYTAVYACLRPSVRPSIHPYRQTDIHTYIQTHTHTHIHIHIHASPEHAGALTAPSCGIIDLSKVLVTFSLPVFGASILCGFLPTRAKRTMSMWRLGPVPAAGLNFLPCGCVSLHVTLRY